MLSSFPSVYLLFDSGKTMKWVTTSIMLWESRAIQLSCVIAMIMNVIQVVERIELTRLSSVLICVYFYRRFWISFLTTFCCGRRLFQIAMLSSLLCSNFVHESRSSSFEISIVYLKWWAHDLHILTPVSWLFYAINSVLYWFGYSIGSYAYFKHSEFLNFWPAWTPKNCTQAKIYYSFINPTGRISTERD